MVMTNMQTTNILLAALGTTPQIITESLYHLMVQQGIRIHEIHLITTTEGKSKAEKQLFNNGQGAFYQFCREYGFSSTEVYTKFHVIANDQSLHLSDIRTTEDNQIAANFFLNVVKNLTARADTRIFATIAGGRKTMSAYLYLTMQLLGREKDTLYHVLVHPESIESNPNFFFPTANVEEMQFQDRQGQLFTVPVNQIRIDMAEIPFVKLSNILNTDILQMVRTYQDLVTYTQSEIDNAYFEPYLKVDIERKMLIIQERDNTWEVRLHPTEMCLYKLLCEKGELNPAVTETADKLAEYHKKYYAIANVNKGTFEKEALQQIRSKINRKIRDTIKPSAVREFIQIQTTSPHKYGNTTYSLNISPNRISILNDHS